MEIVLERGRSEHNYWRDLWFYRELFYVLAWRDLAVRYKQTVIGIAWALLRPFLTMVVFTVVFGKIAKLPTPGAIPYALFVFVAMLPWQFFSTALTESSASLITNANLVSKIYFPRLVVPAAAVITSFADFLVSFAILVGMAAWYHFWPDWRICLLPAFMLLAFGTAMGAGLWLCALNVQYRDFRYVVPFIAQLGIYISPVGFSSAIVPERWRFLYSLNPMVGVIDGFRWSLLRGEAHLYWPGLALSVVFTGLLLSTGLRYFRRMEKTFADVI